MHFINHLGKRGADFLHPGGKAGTDYLIGEMLKHQPQRILEVGCGTGATLISLASVQVPFLRGIDISPSQVEVANKRIKYCGQENNIQVEAISESAIFPFADHSFDMVFAESVLGILAHHQLIQVMHEVFRVLKPDGLFLSNDAIWKAGVTPEQVNAINSRTLKDFGLIQSSSVLIGRAEWLQFFSSVGFVNQMQVEVNEVSKAQKTEWNELERLSHDFSTKQKGSTYFHPSILLHEMIYWLKLKFFHRKDYYFLENIIFVLKAKKIHP